MASPTYSTRFVAAAGVAPDVYTVPTAQRAVIRCIDVFEGGAETSTALIIIAKGVNLFGAKGVSGTPAWSHWEGRQVLYAGEQLTFFNSGSWSDWHLMISGYLLAD